MINLKTILFFVFPLLLFDCDPNTKSIDVKLTPPQIPTDSILFNLENQDMFPRTEVTQAYCRAISEYISTVYNNTKPLSDTLFIGTKGVGFEFPDIELPPTINKTNIRLLTYEEAETIRKNRKSYTFLNTIGWRMKNKSEFIFVTFFEGGKPQHNYHMKFTTDPEKHEIKLDTLYLEHVYPKQ